MKTPSGSIPPQTTTFAFQDNSETAEAPTLHIDWNDWLEKVQALPSESSDWEDIPQFLEALQQLYENKQQEREERNTQRQRLQATLSNLTTQAEDILTFFEIRDISQWTVEACSPPHIATATQLSEQLFSLLLEHHKHNQQSAPTRTEARLHRQKVEQLEDDIEGIYERLAKLFSPSLGQDSQYQKEEENQEAAGQSETSSKPASETLNETPPISRSEGTSPQEARASLQQEIESEFTDSQTDQPKLSATPESAPSKPRPPVRTLRPQLELPTVQADQGPIISKEETPKLMQGERDEEDDEKVSAVIKADENRQEQLSSNDPSPSNFSPEPIGQKEAPSIPVFVEPEISPSDILLPGARSPEIQGIAFRAQTASDQEKWTNLLWALIAEDALPTAYWLVRGLQEMKHPCPISADLLAAIQTTRWLLPNSQAFVYDLADIVRNVQSPEDEPQKFLGLSAALRATLLAPSTGIQTWLSIPKSCPSLRKIVKAVETFANWGRPLRPDDLLGVTDVKQHKESLQEATRAARTWLEEARQRRVTTFKPAAAVWSHITAPSGVLWTFLLPVVEDDRKKLSEVRKNLKQWQDSNRIVDCINQIDRELAGKKAGRIDGNIRARIVRNFQEACDLARHWCDCVEREREVQGGKDPFFQKANEVRSQLQVALPEVIQSLQELISSPGQTQPTAAAAQCLLRSVEQLQIMFANPLLHHEQDWFTGNIDSLWTALDRLLLWLPDVPREDGGQIVEANLPQVVPALCRAIAEGRSLQSAFDIWLAKHDYRFIDAMLAAFDEADLSTKSRVYQEALEGARGGLLDAMSKTRTALDRAVIDGISAEERAKHEGIIEAIKPVETLYFPPKREQLEQIKTQLEEAHHGRLQEVQTAWDQLQPKLVKQLDPARLESIKIFVESNLTEQETRVVEECVAHLTEVIETGIELEEHLFSNPEGRDALQEFLKAIGPIEIALQRSGMSLRQVEKNIKNGSSVAGINFGETPKARLEEAGKAISAWRSLKQEGVNGESIQKNLADLLGYLGFTSMKFPSNPNPSKGKGTDYIHIRAQMSASDLTKPIPQFGSQTHGRYDIVCVWERPGADTMSAWLRDLRLDTHPVFVFYLGRLTDRQRHDYAKKARKEELVIAVLDEILLVFLARERDARLPIFLRCTLPFSAVNPYTPFQAGNVPPEVFFGRNEMARELQRSSGGCLVYGGRQLGKSALLQHVRREFHDPEQNRYAWVKDIKSLGDSQPPEKLWAQVRDGFKELELLPPTINTDNQKKVIEHVQAMMDEAPERRVIILFDEADNFLDADANDRFQVVDGLRTLMSRTERRFKVVFTGLHNVQRFQGIPNQPLAHFGTPLLVGPLEVTAAQQLVRKPLEVLGYRFDGPGTILRILSYTNYHPGLIQLFCYELLKRLQQQRRNTSPPYSVTQDDVEAVYLLRPVRDGIRDRFNWTLGLDKRYQAIVWAMILEQIDIQGGYARAYAPANLLELARAWWPQGFDKVASDQLRGLLDEMEGLGVLVRDASGSYRLRSPNLVRLVGAKADIEGRLLILSDEKPEEVFDADSHHARIGDQVGQYSPLTHAQERRLNVQKFGVGLVFASEATGLTHLNAAFEHFIPANSPETKGGNTETRSDYKEIPSTRRGTELKQWLDQHLRTSRNNYERLILHCPLQGKPEDLLETIQIAHEVCQRREHSRKRWMRIFFIFDPQSTWNWLSLSQPRREEIEDKVDVVTFPRQWNLSGVRQRLRQQNKMDLDEVCRRAVEVTGGWPLLLDKLFESCGTDNDPRRAAKIIERDLGDSHSQFSQDFKRSLGLNDIAERILNFIKNLQEDGQKVPVDLITPEYVESSPGLSQDECDTAIEYLQRMGCIKRQYDEQQSDLLSVDPTVLRLI